MSHRAGAKFTPLDEFNDVCTTTVKSFTYNNNEAATILLDTQTIKDWYNTRLKLLYNQGLLKEGTDNKIYYPEIKDGIKFFVADNYSDVHFGIGRAKVKQLEGNASVVKKDGKLCVESLGVQAQFEDMYDYNYYAQGAAGELLSQRAAMLQLGWNSGLGDGSGGAGEVFYNKFIIDRTINLYIDVDDFINGITRKYSLCF